MNDSDTGRVFQQAADQTNDLVMITEGTDGADTRIVYVNDAWLRATGYARHELIGSSPSVLRGPHTGTEAIKRIDAALVDQRLAREELVNYAKDGREFVIDLETTPVRNGSGLTHYVSVGRETSRRRPSEELREKLEEQLFRSQKMESVNALAGGIAHDFNNILTGILGSAELARMSLPSGHPASEDLDTIVQAAQRAAVLTKELLAYTGSGKGAPEVISLNDIVTNILVILRSQMSRSIIVRKALMPSVPYIEADPVQVKQIMMNLSLNASEAMRERGGILSITTDEAELVEEDFDRFVLRPAVPGRYATFEVTDTGSGIDEKIVKRMFEPFFTTKSEGRGLGLTAVAEIVKQQHGGIEVMTTRGEGTTVRVYLPASEEQPRATLASGSEVSRGTQTILFVDDEEMLRSLAQRALEQLGYRVILAADGVEAVRLYREHADVIDLVILDLSMPRKGGEDAYLEMRDVRKDMRVLLCCGYNETSTNKKIAPQHLAGFLPKPFGIDVLAKTVEVALKR